MKRTALIAAFVSLIPLAASAVTANADPYGRSFGPRPGFGPGYGYGYRPPVVHYVPPRGHFAPYHVRRDWHPRRHWGMHRGWGWR